MILWFIKLLPDICFVIHVKLRILQDVTVMRTTTETCKHTLFIIVSSTKKQNIIAQTNLKSNGAGIQTCKNVHEHQLLITDYLHLNCLYLFPCVIILSAIQRFVHRYVSAINTTDHTLETISIFEKICCSLLGFTVRPLDILRHELFNQQHAQVFNNLENCPL